MAARPLIIGTRIVTTVVGIAAIAFLALSLRGVNLLYEANRLLLEKPPRAAEAISKARAAGKISMGQADELIEVGALVGAGRRGEAIAPLRRSLAAEPDNVSGWQLLGELLIASGREAQGRRALARAKALNGALPAASQPAGRAP